MSKAMQRSGNRTLKTICNIKKRVCDCPLPRAFAFDCMKNSEEIEPHKTYYTTGKTKRKKIALIFLLLMRCLDFFSTGTGKN